MKFVVIISILSIFVLAHSAEEDNGKKCPCFCYNKGAYFRRVIRAKRACDRQPKSSNCIVVTNCRRGGRTGAACCDAPEREDRVCPCKCRGSGKARRIARIECMKRRGLCAVKTCGNRKNPARWQCCDKRGGKRGNGDNDGDNDGGGDGENDSGDNDGGDGDEED